MTPLGLVVNQGPRFTNGREKRGFCPDRLWLKLADKLWFQEHMLSALEKRRMFEVNLAPFFGKPLNLAAVLR